MGENSVNKTIKTLLFFFNVLFWLSGIALIVIGALIKVNYGDYLTIADSKYTDISIFIMVIGVIVMVMGFLGCVGAWQENYCMLVTFCVVLTIIFIMQIVGGALGFAYRGKVQEEVDGILKRTVSNYYKEPGSKKFMDWAQKTFECCGNKDGAAEYSPKKPASCSTFKKGCQKAFGDFAQDKLLIIGAVAIAVACIQVLGIIFSALLARDVKGQYEVI